MEALSARSKELFKMPGTFLHPYNILGLVGGFEGLKKMARDSAPKADFRPEVINLLMTDTVNSRALVGLSFIIA